MPVRAAWCEPFENELLRFPTARHDDQVDSLGLIGQLLDEIHVAKPRVAPKAAAAKCGYECYPDDALDPHFDPNTLMLF